MIFDNRLLQEIRDDEILEIVNLHYKERQHLEFKITVKLDEPEEKLELLCDIASLANGGGGYLIVGIRDDGSGMAQKFEPDLVGNTDRIRKSIRDLCLDHIHERILGLEHECRVIEGNPIIIIRVPNSDRIPHMVSFNRRTYFVTRYEDGKREMRFAEIKEIFIGDSFNRRLASIEGGVSRLLEIIGEQDSKEQALEAAEKGTITHLLTNVSGKVLSEAYRKRFSLYAGQQPFFSISAIPEHPNPNYVDFDSPEIKALIAKPPQSRYAGWNMDFKHFPIENVSFGIKRGRDDFRSMEFWRNGYVELRTSIDEDFCWGQDEVEFQKQPKFNPVTISEYIVSFLRFYSSLLKICGNEQGAFLNIQYLHVRGYKIRSLGYFSELSKGFSEEDLIIPDYKLMPGFDSDKIGYKLLTFIFGLFAFGPEDIPAWNNEEGIFEFDKMKS